MTRRALAMAGAALLLLLTGCGGLDQHSSAGQPAPIFSRPAGSTEPAAPTPQPTGDPPPGAPPGTSPRPRPKTSPGPLPPGLRRSTGVRGVALTFDDGPDPAWTPKVLDALRTAKAPAVFCVVGARVERHPALVARIVREGHQLCNHSWRHDVALGSRPKSQIRADLDRTNRAIEQAVPGAEVRFYRQPGGRWTPAVVAVAEERGMESLHWNVDPQDWAKPPAKQIVARVSAGLRPGAVVLLHDGGGDRAATLAACPAVIGEIKRRYGFAKLK
ncbi:polysaccharide deacetylase family protein [Micromonospora sp. WMMD882]|uniref:polysaccharide deacetylase family protein n=1 Tax=Micromonospora sp. WMMD882 TaxID=3015151 RepID=UPI00248AEEF6|nr:polysaccharide deacetylase family protein [Micromonospora sp. WMMD882]WBB78123.1 polysaccharide deacetylase family protein [Micromonospora sp. WMMD882]